MLAIFAVLSLLLTLWQWVVTWRFPLNQRVEGRQFAPPVTLLKPLKGLDDKTMDCLRSWLKQDYSGAIQVLFGVASPEDPVCALVRELIQESPGCNAELVICKESLGVNAKVSTLIQLQRLAQHDVIVVSDADVFVPPD
ncbi:MAG TPA: glycosyltransferase, partial [Verrucomicrobiae bacterium]|nr:glycosyltransferase [Verrucomicrobiae bacterium]